MRRVVILVLAVIAGVLWPGAATPGLLNALVWLGLLAAVVWVVEQERPLLVHFRGLPWPQRALAVALPLLFVVGHVTGEDRKTFPFVEWPMYCQAPQGPLRIYSYRVVDDQGQEHEFLPSLWRPSLRSTLVPFSVGRLAEEARTAEDAGRRERARLELEELLQALAVAAGKRQGRAGTEDSRARFRELLVREQVLPEGEFDRRRASSPTVVFRVSLSSLSSSAQ